MHNTTIQVGERVSERAERQASLLLASCTPCDTASLAEPLPAHQWERGPGVTQGSSRDLPTPRYNTQNSAAPRAAVAGDGL